MAGLLLLAAGVVLHLSFMLPHFLPEFVDPAVPAVRVLHGSFGILAVLTAFVQLWPGLRRRWPRLHRWSGRAYVFAGVLPCSVMLAGLLFAIGNPANTASFFWGTVWAVTTAIAWRAARRGQFDKHRQWMSYSVALTLVVTTSAGLVVAAPLLAPLVSPALVVDSIDWLPWVLHLAVAHWFVVRGKSASRAKSVPVAGDPVVIDLAQRAAGRRRRPGEHDEAAAA
ncbi:DUF2306 domain-containing protein [Amycolatopsis sp. WQ 127309]|uniref:DUF2306 domain-containing protein n=1 Tax=Amycolatopsis sp. WQ 127309 TaxID=2932773 RepID=UPI001FF1B3A6|nr:DUF2306 domain-containing protein [Amycolatopsis sp. WQ 127309]UOZ06698.1 DUF2306 domain-containing protein [Amycolatopsis sp. WQ 127309]